jgi:hypothetical protein
MIGWVIALALAVCTGVAFAGEEAKKAPTPEEMQAQMKAYMEAGMPGPHHEVYKSIVGKYDATITMWNGPGEPTVAKGKSTYEMTLGDRFLTHTHESNMMGMPFAGYGVSGFDKTKNKHTAFWIDNMGTHSLYAEGECTDKCMKESYTFTMADPVLKTENKMKMVSTVKSKDEHVMEWFMINPDGSSVKHMEIVYKRASS